MKLLRKLNSEYRQIRLIHIEVHSRSRKRVLQLHQILEFDRLIFYVS